MSQLKKLLMTLLSLFWIFSSLENHLKWVYCESNTKKYYFAFRGFLITTSELIKNQNAIKSSEA